MLIESVRVTARSREILTVIIFMYIFQHMLGQINLYIYI